MDPDILEIFHTAHASRAATVQTIAPTLYWERVGRPHAGLPDAELTRAELRTYCASVDTEKSLLAILAWGMARPKNAQSIYANLEKCVALIEDAVGMARSEQFDHYKTKRVPGLGPAFFTKLIHFCGDGSGYILDQFTAKSYELLMGEPRAFCGSNGYVRRGLTGQDYERFCLTVETLAKLRDWAPEFTELAMYGGKGHGWRDYVRAEWPKMIRRAR